MKPHRKRLNRRRLIVDAIAVLSALGAGATPFTTPTATSAVASGTKPGKWRWDVKTLSDPAASKLVLNMPKSLDVKQAADFDPPDEHLTIRTPRGVGNEENLSYTVQGFVIGYKLEDDGDYHIIVSDTNPKDTPTIEPKNMSPVLGVELPTPGFMGSSSYRSLVQHAHDSFESLFESGPSRSHSYHWLKEGIKVKITGVGFWDEYHGQRGLRTGFELHPVIAIEKVG